MSILLCTNNATSLLYFNAFYSSEKYGRLAYHRKVMNLCPHKFKKAVPQQATIAPSALRVYLFYIRLTVALIVWTFESDLLIVLFREISDYSFTAYQKRNIVHDIILIES